MLVHEINPIEDPRWSAFLESHPHSSVFHTPQWLQALRRTYNYAPLAFTTDLPGAPLTNGIVFCVVDSWITGSRLVSLPFSDHCEPLIRNGEDLDAILSAVRRQTAERFNFAEIRPRCIELQAQKSFDATEQFSLHALDLRSGLEQLYSGLHKNSVQRKIRRAEREHIVLHQGRSDLLLEQFYTLLLQTRRRHGRPPQPLAWFRNLVGSFGPLLTIRVATAGGEPIASILTLRHKKTLVYKYGGSDARFHKLGAMSHLFWQAIQEARAEGLEEFDLGRSDETNAGLIQFKGHLGASRTILRYWRFSSRPSRTAIRPAEWGFARNLLVRLPDRLFRLLGEFSYRHAG